MFGSTGRRAVVGTSVVVVLVTIIGIAPAVQNTDEMVMDSPVRLTTKNESTPLLFILEEQPSDQKHRKISPCTQDKDVSLR